MVDPVPPPLRLPVRARLLVAGHALVLRVRGVLGRAGGDVPAVGVPQHHARAVPHVQPTLARAHRDVLLEPPHDHAHVHRGRARTVPRQQGGLHERRRPQPAAAGLVDDHPPAGAVHRVLVVPVPVRHRVRRTPASRLRRLGEARHAVGRVRHRGAGHRLHHGWRVGLQGAGLGWLLGLGPGRERFAHPVARHGGARARSARAARHRLAARHELRARHPELRARAVRLVPHAQRRAGRLLRTRSRPTTRGTCRSGSAASSCS